MFSATYVTSKPYNIQGTASFKSHYKSLYFTNIPLSLLRKYNVGSINQYESISQKKIERTGQKLN